MKTPRQIYGQTRWPWFIPWPAIREYKRPSIGWDWFVAAIIALVTLALIALRLGQ